MTKQITNIHHKISTDIYCTEKLYKEQWGIDAVGTPFWRLTCNKCGFAKVINNNTFLNGNSVTRQP